MAVKITDRIGTFGESDIYATHDGNRGALGFHSVNSTIERNQITYDRRRGSYQVDGQPPLPFFVAVRTLDEVKLYWLRNEPGTPETTDDDWEEFIAGSEDPFQGFFSPLSAPFVDGVGTKGHYWIASAAGPYNAGSGTITYAQYDKAQYDGSIWQKVGGSSAVADWNTMINKPSQFTPTSHSHSISEVNSLQTELDNKVGWSDTESSVSGLADKIPTSEAITNYTYSQSTIDNKISNLSTYGIKYAWNSDTAQAGQSGMLLGDLGLREDEQKVYKWSGIAWIEFFTINTSGAALTEEVISDVDCGAIEIGDKVLKDTVFTAFVKQLLTKVTPPVYESPFTVLEIVGDTEVEIGYIATHDIHPNVNIGDSGGVISYTLNRISDSTVLLSGITDAIDYSDIVEVRDVVSYLAIITYAQGPVKNDSAGNPYPIGRINQTTMMTSTVNITPYRKLFYDLNNEYNDSDAVRNSDFFILNPQEGTTFEINIPIGTTDVSFAYPATLRDVSRVLDTGSNYDIKSSFIQVGFDVEGANGFDPIPYKVYKFHPAVAFTRAVKYIITI